MTTRYSAGSPAFGIRLYPGATRQGFGGSRTTADTAVRQRYYAGLLGGQGYSPGNFQRYGLGFGVAQPNTGAAVIVSPPIVVRRSRARKFMGATSWQ